MRYPPPSSDHAHMFALPDSQLRTLIALLGAHRTRSFLTIVVGVLLLGGCAAKQTIATTQPASNTATSGSAPPISPNNSDLARDEYDRAVANYQSCVLDNTVNLSACEKQRAAMNSAATILFGPPSKKSGLVNDGK